MSSGFSTAMKSRYLKNGQGNKNAVTEEINSTERN